MVASDRCLLFFLNFLLFSLRCLGFLDIDEIKNTHYGIELLKTPVSLDQEATSQMVLLSTIHGQKYRCNYPDHTTSREEAEGKGAEQIGIPDLLKPMEDGPCVITTKDWWTYEFCYGKYLQQYHMEDGVAVGKVIYLGFYDSEYNWKDGDKQETKQNKERLNRYHSQQYVNGTVCDLTNKARRVEVRFLCDEGSGDYISRIDEPESCVYVLTLHTTKICHHPYLKPLSPSKPLPITCNPVLDAEQYQEYLDFQEAQKAREEVLAHERKKYSAEANKDQEGSGEKLVGSGDMTDGGMTSASDSETEGKEVAQPGERNVDMLKTFKDAMVNSVRKEFGGNLDGSDNEGLDLKMHFKVVKNQEDMEKLIKEIQGGSDSEKEEDDLPAPTVKPPVELMPSEEFIDRSPVGDTGPSAKDIRQNTAAENTHRTMTTADRDYQNRLTKVKSQLEKFTDLVNKNKLDREDNTQAKDNDKQVIQEFDKGVEQLVKEGHIREKMASMKNNIKDAVAGEFGDIINEAQAELRREGFDGPINKKEAFVNLASTLDKLLNRLEKSNKELDEVDKRLRDAAETAKKSLMEQRMKSAELLQKMREKHGDGKSSEKGLTDDKTSEESLLKQYEKAHTDLEKRLQEHKLASTKSLKNYKIRSAEMLKKMQDKQAVEPGSAGEEKSIDTGEKEDDVEPHKPDDNKIRVRVTKVKFKDPADAVEKPESPTDTKGVLGDAQKQKLEKSVREELKKAGLDKSGKKIHIKIITSLPNDGTGFQTITDEDSAAFNKMIVTILGGNQDEIQEAERQQQFEDSYNFVYKPLEKKKTETPAIP